MKTYTCKCDQKEIPGALDYIQGCLEEKKIPKKSRVRPMLAAEEILEELCRNAEEGSSIRIDVSLCLYTPAFALRCS